LSRDPLDGNAKDPASLHKYLYANGDPVNGIDPMGRETMFQYAAFTRSRAQAAAAFGFKTDMCLRAALVGISDALNAVMNETSLPANSQNLAFNLGTCEAKAIKGLLGMLLNFATR
jgi:hypothetical protein